MIPSPSICTALLMLAVAFAHAADTPPPGEAPEGMVWVPGGKFLMGSEGPEARPDESPAHLVQVDGFWMDATEVTNAQFRAFIDATDYVTTAERPVDWEEAKKQLPHGTPKPPDEVLLPGSLVFTPPPHQVPLHRYDLWWTWTHHVNWQHPDGPESSIEGRDDYPVVHVSWDDAVAYAEWAGKSLPTEAEWERAARFDSDNARFAWGKELRPNDQFMANIWQGKFPHENNGADGFIGIAPVRQFPANSLGLYDMAGNVWEWTLDQFHVDTYQARVDQRTASGDDSCCVNPQGPSTTEDPRNPHADVLRVIKGGSYLCHITYCESYRPSAKMTAPPDNGTNHTGFRCVIRVPQEAE